MEYRNKKVKETPSELLIYELIKRHGSRKAPNIIERKGMHYESTVGIGNNHTANITLSTKDYSQLIKMITDRTILENSRAKK